VDYQVKVVLLFMFSSMKYEACQREKEELDNKVSELELGLQEQYNEMEYNNRSILEPIESNKRRLVRFPLVYVPTHHFVY
jgi:hypothetical protein